MEIILNSPRFDYLTLSWPNTSGRGLELAQKLSALFSDQKESPYIYDKRKLNIKRAQYEGAIFSENIMVGQENIIGEEVGFFGSAEQGALGKWWLLQTESKSHQFWEIMSQHFLERPRFTRIDTQVTIDHPMLRFAPLADWPTASKWQVGESIYFNKRTNPRFYRIYFKQHDEGPCIRFEIELKDRGTDGYREIMLTHPNPAHYIFASEYDNMVSRIHPELAKIADEHIKPLLAEGVYTPVRRKQTDHINWLTNQVRPALLKYIKQDDLRLPTLALAYEIIEMHERMLKRVGPQQEE